MDSAVDSVFTFSMYLGIRCFGAFESLQVHTGQVVAERLDNYNRLYSMIRETLAPTDTQNELHISSGKTGETIDNNASVMYQMPILCGLSQPSGKAWPLHKCPITLDFGIVDSSAEWLSGNSSSSVSYTHLTLPTKA